MADTNTPDDNDVPEIGEGERQPEPRDWTDSRGRARGGDDGEGDGADPSAANIHAGSQGEWEAAPMAAGPEDGQPPEPLEVPRRDVPEGEPPADIAPPEIGGPADYVDAPEPEFAGRVFGQDDERAPDEDAEDRFQDLVRDALDAPENVRGGEGGGAPATAATTATSATSATITTSAISATPATTASTPSGGGDVLASGMDRVTNCDDGNVDQGNDDADEPEPRAGQGGGGGDNGAVFGNPDENP